MIQKRLTLVLVLSLVPLALDAQAQIIKNAEPEALLSTQDVRSAIVPQGGISTSTFTVDSSGGNLFRVMLGNPDATVLLVLPDGTEINAENAASLGFDYTAIPDGSVYENSVLPSLIASPGLHVLIQAPGTTPIGTYQIKVDATSSSTDVSVIACQFSSSAKSG